MGWWGFAALVVSGCARGAPIEPVVPSPPAPAPWVTSGQGFLGQGYYSYGVTVRRTGAPASPGDCVPTEVVVANGYDHQPQYAARLSWLFPNVCSLNTVPAAWSSDALYYTDAASADLDRDGVDEVVLTALADPSGQIGTGSVRLVSGAWSERVLVDGLGASGAAVADVDADGWLDVVASAFFLPPALEATPVPLGCDAPTPAEPVRGTQPVNALSGASLAGGVLIWRGGPDGPIHPPWRIPLAGVGAIDAADVDQDGHLDLVTAGRAVHVLWGPLTADAATCALLTREVDSDTTFSMDVDTAPAGTGHTFVAASRSCFNGGECVAELDTRGYDVWRFARGSRDAPAHRSTVLPVITSATRFQHVDEDALPDLVTGAQSAPAAVPAPGSCPQPCGPDPWRLPVQGIGCLGAPLAVQLGADGPDGPWPGAPVGLDVQLGKGATAQARYPMAWRIVPFADPSTAAPVADPGRVTPGRAVTYTGRGFVAGVAAVTHAGAPVPYDWVPGADVLSLRVSADTVDVTWLVTDSPGWIVTSAGIIPPAGGDLILTAPQRRD